MDHLRVDVHEPHVQALLVHLPELRPVQHDDASPVATTGFIDPARSASATMTSVAEITGAEPRVKPRTGCGVRPTQE
jgi:hypothetical protein